MGKGKKSKQKCSSQKRDEASDKAEKIGSDIRKGSILWKSLSRDSVQRGKIVRIRLSDENEKEILNLIHKTDKNNSISHLSSKTMHGDGVEDNDIKENQVVDCDVDSGGYDFLNDSTMIVETHSNHELLDIQRHLLRRLIRDDRRKSLEELRIHEEGRKFKYLRNTKTSIKTKESEPSSLERPKSGSSLGERESHTIFNSLEQCILGIPLNDNHQSLHHVLDHDCGATRDPVQESVLEYQSSWVTSVEGKAMAAVRANLPIAQMKPLIVSTLRDNQVTVVSGATGSGKTTQIPQYILDFTLAHSLAIGGSPNIIVTQPRRIAAISVAERVAYERGESCGQSVGYQIRLQSKYSESTRLLYVTTGVLLRKLQSDSFLDSVTHIIVDEVHERQVDHCMHRIRSHLLERNLYNPSLSHKLTLNLPRLGNLQVETDLLLCVLRLRLQHHPRLKLVLMSATMSEDLFVKYFGGCPCIRVPGRCFPVTVGYMDAVSNLLYGAQRDVSQFRAAAAESTSSVVDNRLCGCHPEKNGSKEHPRVRVGSSARLPKESGNITLSPPTMDTELVAELVIRILQNYSSFDYSGSLSRISALNRRKTQSSATTSPTDAHMGENANQVNEVVDPGQGQAILVFLPGMQDIDRVHRALGRRGVFSSSLRVSVIILHGSLSPEQQRFAFQPAAPGHWRVVLSTDIAETSVTLPDVTHVIDCGLHKLMTYEPRADMSLLQTEPICRSSARQRAGRAGRVGPGYCWRLYSKKFFDSNLDDENFKDVQGSGDVEEVDMEPNDLLLGVVDGQVNDDLMRSLIAKSNPSCRNKIDKNDSMEGNSKGVLIEDSDEASDGPNDDKYLDQDDDDPEHQDDVFEAIQLETASDSSEGSADTVVAPSRSPVEPSGQSAQPTGMSEHDDAEMRRSPLEGVVLQVLMLGLGDRPGLLLSRCLEPPSRSQFLAAVQALLDMAAVEVFHTCPSPAAIGAGTSSNGNGLVNETIDEIDDVNSGNTWEAVEEGPLRLTSLGRHLASLPLDPRLGKALLTAHVLGRRCLSAVETIVATLSSRTPFIVSGSSREEARRAHLAFLKPSDSSAVGEGFMSDHLAVVRAYVGWQRAWKTGGREAAWTYCRTHWLSFAVLQDIRKLRRQFHEYLLNSGLLVDGELPTDLEEELELDVDTEFLVQCAMVSGLGDRVVRLFSETVKKSVGRGSGSAGRKRDVVKWYSQLADGTSVGMHPGSLLSSRIKSLQDLQRQSFIIFHKKVCTTKAYVYECGLVPVLALLLFGPGPPLASSKDRRLLLAGGVSSGGRGWLQAATEEAHAVLLKQLQGLIRSVVDSALSAVVGTNVVSGVVVGDVMEVVRQLLDPK